MKAQITTALLAILMITCVTGARPVAADPGTATFFFRDSIAGEPAPNEHQTGDTFVGGTWQRHHVDIVNGDSAITRSVTINHNGNPSFWRLGSFVSVPLAAQNIAAGSWTVELNGRQSAPTVNARLRAMAYVWKVADFKGPTIFGPTTDVNDLPTSMASISMLLPGASVVVEEGDRIVVDVVVETWGAASGFVDLSWNGVTQVGKLVAPSVVETIGSPVPVASRGGLALLASAILFIGALAARGGTARQNDR